MKIGDRVNNRNVGLISCIVRTGVGGRGRVSSEALEHVSEGEKAKNGGIVRWQNEPGGAQQQISCKAIINTNAPHLFSPYHSPPPEITRLLRQCCILLYPNRCLGTVYSASLVSPSRTSTYLCGAKLRAALASRPSLFATSTPVLDLSVACYCSNTTSQG